MNDELYHWGLRRGEEKKGHKYSYRELIGTKNGKNKYRYFYNKAKEKINNLGSGTKKPENSNKKVGLIIPIIVDRKKFGKTLDKLANTLVSAIKKTASFARGKKKTEEIVKRYANKKNNYATQAELDLQNETNKKIKDYKYIAKVKTKDGKYRYFYNKNELEAYYKNNGDEVEQTLLRRNGLKEEPDWSEQDQMQVNEHYENGGTGYRMNCYSCSMAWDLRRKGFNVEAIKDPDGLAIDEVYDCYKHDGVFYNTTPMSTSQASKTFTTLMRNEGDGAHGIITVYWANGSGHAMNWEVIDGEVVIRDSQTQMLFREKDIPYLFSNTAVNYSSSAIHFIRTDDKDLDESILKYVQKDS